MKNFIKDVIISIVIMLIFFYALIGSWLQESYKLCPVTEEEIMEVQND